MARSLALDHVGDVVRNSFPNFVENLRYFAIADQPIAQDLMLGSAHAEALAVYEKALSIDSRNPILRNNIGVLLCTLRRHEEALGYFTQAIGAKTSYAEAFNNRAAAYMHIKQYKEAIQDYETALSLHPDYKDALQGRAKALLWLSKSKLK